MFVYREPRVLHADVDAFFASVAQRDDPALRGLPVIVGGGVVLAASYEARRFGIRSGMGGAAARRLCPQAVIAQPSWESYVDASRAVFAVLEGLAPVVERLGLEEAFLDLGEHPRAPVRETAERLRREVREQAGLPITVGAGRTKIVAKMASRAAKPDGLLVVTAAGEDAFLHPLAVEELWGIGGKTAAKLHACGLRTVGQLARCGEAQLVEILGKGSGRHVHALAHNHDRHPVTAERRRRSYGSQRAYGRAPRPPDDLDETLARLAERIAKRMQSSGDSGRTVLLRLRFGDYERVTRSHTLRDPTAAGEPILGAARMLLAAAMPMIERRGLTCLGISVANLASAGSGTQLELLDGGGAGRPG
jgi:DNA polymerase-4